MAAIDFWTEKLDANTGTYTCPWCARNLKAKVSNSVKNPGKSFVSCSKDYGGCGLFSFLDAVPNEKFNPNKGGVKRARGDGGNNVIGPVADAPGVVDTRLAELAAKIDALTTEVQAIAAYIKEVTEN